jgi:hypothetical protein
MCRVQQAVAPTVASPEKSNALIHLIEIIMLDLVQQLFLCKEINAAKSSSVPKTARSRWHFTRMMSTSATFVNSSPTTKQPAVLLQHASGASAEVQVWRNSSLVFHS